LKLTIKKSVKLSSNDVLVTRALYYRYSSWLLGYLMEVVKDYEQAQYYLIEVFKDVPHRLDELTGTDSNPWMGLQTMAKGKLVNFDNGPRLRKPNNATDERLRFDSYVSAMTTEQQVVFCGVYYYQKSTAILALELNKTDQEVKQILKDAFIMIKNG